MLAAGVAAEPRRLEDVARGVVEEEQEEEPSASEAEQILKKWSLRRSSKRMWNYQASSADGACC